MSGDGGAAEAMREAFIASQARNKELTTTLRIIQQWLERKPSPGGKTYGHGSEEMRKLITKVLG